MPRSLVVSIAHAFGAALVHFRRFVIALYVSRSLITMFAVIASGWSSVRYFATVAAATNRLHATPRSFWVWCHKFLSNLGLSDDLFSLRIRVVIATETLLR